MYVQALALVGYCGPPRGPGPNILALDGGGIRGIIAIEMLRHLERQTGRRVTELFDYIVGVSTGAIIAAVLGSGASLDAARHMYYTLSREMFGNTSLLGAYCRHCTVSILYYTVLYINIYLYTILQAAARGSCGPTRTTTRRPGSACCRTTSGTARSRSATGTTRPRYV